MYLQNRARRGLLKSLIALTPSSNSLFLYASEHEKDSMSKIRSRLRMDQLSENRSRDASKWISSISDDSTWSDINYSDRSIGNWLPTEHLRRLKWISASLFQATDTNNKKEEEIKKKIEQGLKKWFQLNPKSENWWHNTIGQQLEICATLILMQGNISEETLRHGVSKLVTTEQVPADRKTGQNLIWYLTQQLYRGVLINSENDILTASSKIQKTLEITDLEGLQEDFSFHQHGNQLYTGGYGLEFLKNHTQFAAILYKTDWAYSEKSMENLTKYAIDGIAPIMRRNWIDYGARGREITRSNSTATYSIIEKSLRRLAQISKDKNTILNSLQRINDPQSADFAPYTKAYPRSDFICHQTSDGYISVKMMSSRTVGTESGNGENLRGYWLPFGSTFIVRDGFEYEEIISNWRWARIPGVTAPDTVPSFKGYLRSTEAEVGVIASGIHGVATMPLNTEQTTCTRTWFLFHNQMIALGCDLSSAHNEPVFTTLDQSLYRGKYLADSHSYIDEKLQTKSISKKIIHNGITYESLTERGISATLSSGPQEKETAATAFVRKPSNEITITLAIEHGTQPRHQDFAYRVALSDRTDSFKILKNNTDSQAIELTENRIILAAVHKPIEINLDSTTSIRTKNPCLLIAEYTAEGWTLKIHSTVKKGARDIVEATSGSIKYMTYM